MKTIVFSGQSACFGAGLRLISEILAAISLILVLYLSFRSLRSMSRFENLIPDFTQYISKDEKGEIVMDERIVAIIDAVGSRLFQSAKMSMLQSMSVEAKLDKGLKGAFAKDIIDNQLPILNLAGDILGYNVKQYVAKNPDALMQLLAMPQVQQFLGGMMGQRNNPSQGNYRSKY